MGDRLPYLGHLDEVTLKTRDGLLVQTIHLRGFPFETASDDELNYRKAMRETLAARRRQFAAGDLSPCRAPPGEHRDSTPRRTIPSAAGWTMPGGRGWRGASSM